MPLNNQFGIEKLGFQTITDTAEGMDKLLVKIDDINLAFENFTLAFEPGDINKQFFFEFSFHFTTIALPSHQGSQVAVAVGAPAFHSAS